jgi:hypothetical protein
MSAYVPDGWTCVGSHQAIVPVLMKSFTNEQLAGLVEIALDLPRKYRRPVGPRLSCRHRPPRPADREHPED